MSFSLKNNRMDHSISQNLSPIPLECSSHMTRAYPFHRIGAHQPWNGPSHRLISLGALFLTGLTGLELVGLGAFPLTGL